MKQTLGCFFFITIVLAGCKKGTGVPTALTSFSIVNASVDIGPITARFSGLKQVNYWNDIGTTTDYGSYNIFTVLADVPFSVAIASNDTLHPGFTGNVNLRNGDLNTLFLAGPQSAMDGVLIQQLVPYYYDSSVGIQFINLSYNSSPICITNVITPTVEDVSALAYKQYTPMLKYPAKSINAVYSFQIRDAASKTVLATYNLNTPFFKSVALAWIGQQGGTGADTPRIIQVNNFK